MRRKYPVSLALAMIALVAACGGGAEDQEPTTTVSDTIAGINQTNTVPSETLLESVDTAATETTTVSPVTATAGGSGSAEEGAKIVKAKCAACHGPDGTGNTAMGAKLKIRSFASPEVQSQSNAEIAVLIAQGKSEQSKKAHQSKALTPAQIEDVVAWIRTLR